MKQLSLWFVVSLVWLPCRLTAQAEGAAEAALERKANEERYNMLNARIVNLIETQELLSRRSAKLEERVESLMKEINKLKEESTRSGGNYATRDELKSYVEKLQEIERKREADNELVLKSIRDLAKAPLTPHAEPRSTGENSDTAATRTVTYTVKQSGETVGEIIKAYNAKFKEQGLGTINLDQVKKANPDLNPNRIQIKQTILIPIPPKK